MTDGEPETAVSASLQKIKSIKNQHKQQQIHFYIIKSQTSDSFVNHFDGHFAYLKTLDFSFNIIIHILSLRLFLMNIKSAWNEMKFWFDNKII